MAHKSENTNTAGLLQEKPQAASGVGRAHKSKNTAAGFLQEKPQAASGVGRARKGEHANTAGPLLKRLRAGLPAALFWLAVWQLGAWAVGHSLLLPGPAETAACFLRLICSADFWIRVGFTALRVLGGFVLGGCAGCLLAALAAACPAARPLLAVPVQLLKAAPVASFIILALLWVRSRWLALLISGFMALPILYTALLEGILQAGRGLLEMAQVFRLPPLRALRAVWLPQLLPYAFQGLRLALGLCWKSGIAAEIIALPRGSIGEAFYAAKLALVTGELFAWTAAVLLLSAACERLLGLALRFAARRLGGDASLCTEKGGAA